MGKGTFAMGGRSKHTCACDGGRGVICLLLWCIRTN